MGGEDYGSITPSQVIDTLPRAYRHNEITAETVEAVLTAMTRNMSIEDATALRKQYVDELALQRAVNNDSDEDYV